MKSQYNMLILMKLKGNKKNSNIIIERKDGSREEYQNKSHHGWHHWQCFSVEQITNNREV